MGVFGVAFALAGRGRGTEWARRVVDGILAVGSGSRSAARRAVGRMNGCRAGLGNDNGLVVERANARRLCEDEEMPLEAILSLPGLNWGACCNVVGGCVGQR